jgi:anaerobic nitric oxide reductase transcription regulator
MIGQSKAHKRLVEEINLVGGSDLTVLITGETGVGKELVAQAIHAASTRADKPIISLNCAALPDTLVESELFGHVRGAFTGAMNDRRGKFELANGGTLFLDEVGELSLTVQAKLLRVLQSGQLQRLGSDKEHQVDVRLIAATNRDLAEEVRSGRYRADFYHRLSVYPLLVPALRDRGRMCCCSAATFWNRTARAWASTACA